MSEHPLSASIAKEILGLRVCLFRLQKKLEVEQEIQEVRAELEALVQAHPEEAACVERVRAGEGSEQDEELLRVDYHFGLRPEWVRRARTGIQRYAFWRRGDLDPERQTPGMLGRYGVDPHNKLNKMEPEELRALVWRCLSAHPGLPMTFNALSVRLFDLTADVTGDTAFEDAVWSLLQDGCVAMTLDAPILMLRTCDLVGLDLPAPTFEPRFAPTQLSLL